MTEDVFLQCPLKRVIQKYFALLEDKERELPSIHDIVKEFKKELLEAALEISRGNKRKAADLLNMNRTSFTMLHKTFQKHLFRKVIYSGKYELVIKSKEEIPEYLVNILTSCFKMYTNE